MSKLLLMVLTIGLILDLYGAMLCKGAVLSDFHKRKMLCGMLLFGVWQLIMLTSGFYAAIFLEATIALERMEHFTTIISIVIFGAFAVHMLKKRGKMITLKNADRMMFYRRKKHFFLQPESG